MLLINPPLHLSGRIKGFWSLRGRPQGQYSGLPKPYVELIISLSGEHFWQAQTDSSILRYSSGWITPLQSGPRFAQTSGPLHLVGARLSIETAVFLFGPDLNRDPAQPIPLEDILGSEASLLRERLLECETELKRLHCFSQWISERIDCHRALTLPSTNVLKQMRWRTDRLADYMNLSSRGLRKRFKTQFGLGPKFWLQLNRFDGVLAGELNASSLAAAAADFGYSDQAHMTTEFGRFAGRPPGKYLLKRVHDSAPEDAPHFIPGSN